MVGPAMGDGRMLGDVLAFAMADPDGVVIVLIRRKRGVNMLPAVCLSAFLCALIVLPFAQPFGRSAHEIGSCWRCSAAPSSASACCCWRSARRWSRRRAAR